MAEISEMAIDPPKMTVIVKIRSPRFQSVRMKLMLWLLKLAHRVSPPNVFVEVLPIEFEGDATKYHGETGDGGKIFLAQWPEGHVLRYHGEIVWREWEL